MRSQSSIPSYWDRKAGATAAVYEDDTLQGTVVGLASNRDHVFGVSEDQANDPAHYYVKYKQPSWRLLATTHPEERILPYEDQQRVAHVDLWSAHMQTKRQGYYLDNPK